MLLAKIEQELNNKILKSIYLFYGEEKFLLENTVNKIKKNFGKLQERHKLLLSRRNKC